MVVFLLIKLLYFISIFALNCINCKIVGKIEVYAFILFIFSESLLNHFLLVFENLNIVQMGIKKTDIC